MFTNFLKKIADRDYLVFSECLFDFTSNGEKNCEVRIFNYDTDGNIQKEENIDQLTNDTHFLLYGGYLLFWLAQILESRTGVNRNDPAFWNKWGPVLNPLFTLGFVRDSSGAISQALSDYQLPDILAQFNQRTKMAVIDKHAIVQFKIHKVYKNSLVRVTNLPLDQEVDGQIYLFVILYDFFCKKYANAHTILGYSCDLLMSGSFNRPFPVIAYKIMESLLENPTEDMSAVVTNNLSGKVWEKIMEDKDRE